MAFWLKLIGTTENPVSVYTENYADSSVGGNEWIGGDDKVLLYATGRQVVFASADVVSEPYDSGRSRWPARVDIRYRKEVPIENGVHVNQIRDNGHELLHDVQHQSFVSISEGEFNRGEQLLTHTIEKLEKK